MIKVYANVLYQCAFLYPLKLHNPTLVLMEPFSTLIIHFYLMNYTSLHKMIVCHNHLAISCALKVILKQIITWKSIITKITENDSIHLILECFNTCLVKGSWRSIPIITLGVLKIHP